MPSMGDECQEKRQSISQQSVFKVLLSTILAFSLTSTEQYVSSPGSNINLSLHSVKNASGHWITKLDTGRYTKKENLQPLSMNVRQGTSNKTEQLAHPSLHDTSMSGAVQLTAASTSTATATTPSSTTTTTTTNTNTSITVTTTTTTTTPSTSNTSSTTTTANTSTNSSSITTTTITITTTPHNTITTTTITTTTTTTPKSCPHPGYQIFGEFNCYKAFHSKGEWKTWSDARDQCLRDGGDLMVIVTEQERNEVYIPLYNSSNFYFDPSVGVYAPQGDDVWTTVKGEPALSTWWKPRQPDNDPVYKCAFAVSTGLLVNGHCAATRPFICEIPV